MRRLSCPAATAAVLLFAMSGARLASAEGCDQYDPAAPARSTRITLGPTDLIERDGDEMRSFVETDSLGQVEAMIVSMSPRGIVRSLAAVPEVSRYSSLYGEGLKGVEVRVSLNRNVAVPRVIISLKQVCAKYFRDTFLY